MRILKINYADFWKGFDREDFITPILKKHFKVEVSDSPDILICSTLHKMKNANTFDCPKIIYTAENHRLNGKGDLTIGFDHESEANYYLPLWQSYLLLHPEYFDMLRDRSAVNYKQFCATVISNDKIKFRNDIFDRINEYKRTMNYGKYKYNAKYIEPRDKDWHNGKINYFRKYPHKFMMAVESSIYPGYCTEKLMDAFLCRSVPIYYGDTTAEYWFNEKAFIYVDETLIDKLKYYDLSKRRFADITSESVFNDEETVHKSVNGFETFLINGIKQVLS